MEQINPATWISSIKTYVLDTNVLLHDPNCIGAFKDNEIFISIIAIEEVDRNKANPTVGHLARQLSRNLDEIRKGGGDICRDGVKTVGGGILKLDVNGDDTSPLSKIGLDVSSNDNKIILLCLRLMKERPGRRVVLVTKDINMRLKAAALGVAAEDYESDMVDTSSIRGDVSSLSVSPDVHRIINQKSFIPVEKTGINAEVISTLMPNCCCELVIEGNPSISVLAIYDEAGKRFELVKKPRSDGQGIYPRSPRQAFAYALCLNQRIPLVALGGRAGTGKTLIALLAGIQLVTEGKFKQIVVFRPTIEVGQSMGFLPGNLEEKFEPWQKPIIKLANKILDSGKEKKKSKTGEIMTNGKLQILPFVHSRGETYEDSFIIVDETQNLKPVEAKTLVTRVGQNSRMIVTGDSGQIDAPFLKEENCGISHIIARMLGRKVFAYCILTKGERSELAELASELL